VQAANLVPVAAADPFVELSALTLLKVMAGAAFGWSLSRALRHLLTSHAVARHLFEE
jgi:hypothetical protein